MNEVIRHVGFTFTECSKKFIVSGLDARSVFLSFKQESANGPISAKNRKCTLEITAYSWDYSAKQRCGLARVHLIYSSASKSTLSLSTAL